MSHTKYCLPSLAVVLLVFFAGAAHAAPAAPAAPANAPAIRTAVEQGKAEAATLLSQGKAAEAYELYSSLLREEPQDDGINLGMARSALAASRPNQALMAYLRLLGKYPAEAQLHKEIAQTYMALGDKEKAEQHLTRDPALSREDADTTLATMGKRYDRLQAHGTVRAGVLFDSNANQGPASATMALGNWQQVQIKDAGEKSTFGMYLGTQLDLGYRLEQAGNWWVVGDVQAYARGNANNDLGANTSRYWQWGRVAGGFRFLDSRSLFDVRMKAEVFDYEFNQHVLAAGPELLYVRAVRPWFQLVSRGGAELRDYTSSRDRNGPYWTAGQYARFFFGVDNHEFMAGGRYMGTSADKNRYSYNGWEGTARFTFKLPCKFETSPFASFTQEFYKGPATALETQNRADDKWRLGNTLTYRINDSWSVEATYQYTINASNSNLYDYDQHLVSTGVAWHF